MVEPQSSKLATRVRFPSSAPRTRSGQPAGILAGRGVVASAPALGAGDRRFESCRPDARPRKTPEETRQETTGEERRRDLEPDPGQADRRGALRGARPEPRRGVQEDCPADQRPRLPSRQGPADGDRPPGRPRCRARPGHQRRAAAEVRRGAPVQLPRAAGAARDRGDPLRGQRGAGVHRRGRREARDHGARLRRPRGDGRRRRGHRRRRRGALPEPPRALRLAHRRRARLPTATTSCST